MILWIILSSTKKNANTRQRNAFVACPTTGFSAGTGTIDIQQNLNHIPKSILRSFHPQWEWKSSRRSKNNFTCRGNKKNPIASSSTPRRAVPAASMARQTQKAVNEVMEKNAEAGKRWIMKRLFPSLRFARKVTMAALNWFACLIPSRTSTTSRNQWWRALEKRNECEV